MNVSILKRGKEEIYENEGIETMFNLLNSRGKNDEQLVLNIIQCVGNVAEEHRARKLLRSGNYLDIIRNSGFPSLAFSVHIFSEFLLE